MFANQSSWPHPPLKNFLEVEKISSTLVILSNRIRSQAPRICRLSQLSQFCSLQTMLILINQAKIKFSVYLRHPIVKNSALDVNRNILVQHAQIG